MEYNGNKNGEISNLRDPVVMKQRKNDYLNSQEGKEAFASQLPTIQHTLRDNGDVTEFVTKRSDKEIAKDLARVMREEGVTRCKIRRR